MPLDPGNYGKELIVDLHDCDVRMMTKHCLENFLKSLCELIDMEMVGTHWWEDLDNEEEHLAGISVVQFIKTSSITIHALTKLEHVYINIFSCKDFDVLNTSNFIKSWFSGKVKNSLVMGRV